MANRLQIRHNDIGRAAGAATRHRVMNKFLRFPKSYFVFDLQRRRSTKCPPATTTSLQQLSDFAGGIQLDLRRRRSEYLKKMEKFKHLLDLIMTLWRAAAREAAMGRSAVWWNVRIEE